MTRLYVYIVLFLLGQQFIFAQSTFSGKRLEAVCLSYLQEQYGDNVEISIITKIPTVSFPENDVTAVVGQDKSFSDKSKARIVFSRDGIQIRTVDVLYRLKSFIEVPMLIRDMKANQMLSPNDFVYQKVDITNDKLENLPAPNELAGSQLRRSLQKGTILTKDIIYTSRQIKRGDKVTIVVLSGGVKIRTTGFALQDAAPGEQLRVKRDTSVLHGRVIDDGSVLITSNN
jgi:flagellar basal body P-ring formation protein FlgA